MASPAFPQDLMIEEALQVPDAVAVTSAPGDSDRLFVVRRTSGVYIAENGALLSTPFLDVEAEAGGLQAFGVLDVAFHPNYAADGRFYVTYLDAQMDAHVAQYKRSAANPNVADPSTRVQILGPTRKSLQSHGWNDLWFGPDGMLYVAIGDDQANDVPSSNPAQDLSNFNGSIVRLDVDAPAPFIPSDNPFLGTPGVDERIFAYGLRQPFRTTFDPVTGHVFVSDVGNHDREEVSAVAFAELAGANFGWRCVEGTSCVDLSTGCPLGCADPNRVDPIHEYDHASGLCAVIGGPVYRGAAFPSLHGKYVFGDFCGRKVWSLRWDGSQAFDLVDHSAEMVAADGRTMGISVSFGTDHEGELYICDQQNGIVWKVVPRPPISTYCRTAANSFGDGARMGAIGSHHVGDASLTLTAEDAPPGTFGYFYYGAGEREVPLGNGYSCVDAAGSWFFRFTPPTVVTADGSTARPIDFGTAPAGAGPGRLTAGSTWYFQYWYRDPVSGGAGFSFSDGLRVTFAP